MDPTGAPQTSAMLDMSLLLVQIVFLAALIERAVAILKKLTVMTWDAPWPLVSLVLSFAACWTYNVHIIRTIFAAAPGPAILFIPGSLFDTFIGACVISGGAAGLVDLVKKTAQKRDELHAARIGQTNGNSHAITEGDAG